MADKFHRGDIFWIDFTPGRGVEQQGIRPALVVQNDRGNTHSSYTVVAAISSAPVPRGYPFIVALAAGEGNLSRAGHVNCAQLMTVDQARLHKKIGSLSNETMARVSEALRYQFDL